MKNIDIVLVDTAAQNKIKRQKLSKTVKIKNCALGEKKTHTFHD